MALSVERYGTRADMAAFVACLALSLTALALPEGLRAPIAGALRRTVLAPALAVEARVARSAENRARLDALRAERDSLALQAQLVPELASENVRLRGLLGLGRRLGTGFVTAEVLHQAGASDGMTMVLSAGRAEGVRPLSPVLTPEGLLGLVRTVDRHTSVAIAWTHPDFRASAMVEGRNVYGIVAAHRGGRAGDLMELNGIAFREAVVPGTLVLTSGLGDVFPRGVPLGTVQGVLSESAGWERTYVLRPAAYPANASHVIVLLPPRAGGDLTAAFADSTRMTATPAAPRPRRRALRADTTAGAVSRPTPPADTTARPPRRPATPPDTVPRPRT